MKKYSEMTLAERQAEYVAAQGEYEKLKGMGLRLNMARGKPGKEQLDMVTPMLSLLTKPEDFISDGIETRNYGEVAGIPAAKRLFADILGCKAEQVFVGGNASLQLMYDAVSKAFTHGLLHSEKPWCKLDKVKWLCPVPGYDRHFKVTESFGVEMINVPMTAEGPDMDAVEELIRDPEVKGMWNVPKYSNPEGVVYSAETIRRLAAMKPAAPDFMLMWDNAYCIHEFDCDYVDFPDILALCAKYGNGDMVYEFASTSKVTFPGAGVGVMASSEANIAYFTKLVNIQTIGFDKINQLRHVLFLQSKAHTLELMQQHAAILKGLRRMEPILQEYGLTLLVEPLNSVKDHKGYYLTDSNEGFDLIREVDSPRVRLLYDIYHQHHMGEDVLRRIEDNLDFIGHYHIAGHPNRDEKIFENFDYRAVFDLLKKHNVTAPVGVELFPSSEDALRQLLQNLRAVVYEND